MKTLEKPPRGIDPAAYSYLYRLVAALTEELTVIDKQCSAVVAETEKLSKEKGVAFELSKRVGLLAEQVSAFAVKVKVMETKVASIESDVAVLEKSVNSLGKNVAGVSNSIENILERLDALEGN